MKNRTLIQFFEWYLPSSCGLWNEVAGKASELKQLGITEVWLPPAYKGTGGSSEVGYAVYDMYDLGEFDQKGSVPTKYGTKDEHLNAVKTLHENGLKVYADIVFNHRMGADETERVKTKVIDSENRSKILGEKEISAYTKFNFTNRQGKYSNFKWNYTHFDGCDWDDATKEKALYLFEGKSWDEQVDIEKGNYDYLMGADLDLNNPETFAELVNWGKWYLDFTGVDGFRIDAVKHINFPKMLDWVREMRKYSQKELFAVGEYWNQTLSALTYYLDKTAHCMELFDVPLHYNFYTASNSNGTYDMRNILKDTLVKKRPKHAITIVDNHDTQPGQALESYVARWFKLHAYALILLREDGLPCVFYGDLYGIPHSNIEPLGAKLETLIKLREELAYGDQLDYFDNENVVGFTRLGNDANNFTGLAAVITIENEGTIHMCMGTKFIGKTLVDCLGNCNEKVVIGNDGCANFKAMGGSVSIYIDENYLK